MLRTVVGLEKIRDNKIGAVQKYAQRRKICVIGSFFAAKYFGASVPVKFCKL